MSSSFNVSKINFSEDNDNDSNKILSNSNKLKTKSMINIKYFKDNSYYLFNEIFSDMEFVNMQEEKIKINDYNDFYNFQLNLNANYKSCIKFFDYKNK